MRTLKRNFYFLVLLWLFAGCTKVNLQTDISNAETTGLKRYDIKTKDYTLASWRKVSDHAKPYHIYIEGDGFAWATRDKRSVDPTPHNPVALKLATKDFHPNVIYIARPCQYVSSNTCNPLLWTDERFSKPVIDSFNEALDSIKPINKAIKFELIGFSGGANIAGLLAANRGDVISLRTVAGNLDNTYLVKLHNVSEMPRSLNMADSIIKLSHIPQVHFIGGKDKIIQPSVFKNYFNKSKQGSCIKSYIVPEAEHTSDEWQNKWPDLLKIPVICN